MSACNIAKFVSRTGMALGATVLVGAILVGCYCADKSCGYQDVDVDPCSADGLMTDLGMWCAMYEQEFYCDCGLSGAPGVDVASGPMREYQVGWWEQAQANSMMWIDEECVRHLGELSFPLKGSVPCPSDDTGRWLGCQQECGIWVGPRSIGESCQYIGRRMSDCQPGLVCGVDEICHSPCVEPTEGSLGQLCGNAAGVVHTPCREGLVCHASRCVVGGELDDACDEEAPCVLPLRCLEGICSVGRDPGAPCEVHSECASLICTEEGCAGNTYCSGESGYCEEPGPYPDHCREWSW